MKQNRIIILAQVIGLLLLLGNTTSARPLKEVIRRGNVIRTTYNNDPEAGCYLGNGRFGAVFSPLGLNVAPEDVSACRIGSSVYSHLNHWGRFHFVSALSHDETTADYLLPLLRVHYEQAPSSVTDYRQEQDFYDGILRTSYTIDNNKVSVTNWFDAVNKDLAGLCIESSRGGLSVKASVVTDFVPYAFVYRDHVSQQVSITKQDDAYAVDIACEKTLNNRQSRVYIYSSSQVELCYDGLRFILNKGKNHIFLSYGKATAESDRKASLRRTQDAWHQTWAKTAWMDLPDDNAQMVWVRSMAYSLYSYDDFALRMIQPTNGLSGNVYPFHYVQDMGYIAPALQMGGHNDIVMRWIEKFADEMDDMKRYAKHLWPETEGIYPPWELPFGSIEGYHEPHVPVLFCYEPHNVAYLCLMACEAADYSGDEAWAERYVRPLVAECCKFYKSACQKGSDGLWHLQWYPCIGQDEAGGRNKSDYLCTLYSAKYCFQKAVQMGLDEDGAYATILRDGLAFESLQSERGTLHTCQGTDDFGKQKHPIQLDGVTYMPTENSPLAYETKAYELRNDITEDAHRPFFQGWTLSQFLLAGSNLKQPEEWSADFTKFHISGNTDKEWIQFYETCHKSDASFYITTHGMVLQSILRNYVNDYWNVLDVAACPVFKGKVSFGNIATKFGVSVSGSIENGKGRIMLRAHRDTRFTLNDTAMTMKKGEVRNINIKI